jgi:hypothetical protein
MAIGPLIVLTAVVVVVLLVARRSAVLWVLIPGAIVALALLRGSYAVRPTGTAVSTSAGPAARARTERMQVETAPRGVTTRSIAVHQRESDQHFGPSVAITAATPPPVPPEPPAPQPAPAPAVAARSPAATRPATSAPVAADGDEDEIEAEDDQTASADSEPDDEWAGHSDPLILGTELLAELQDLKELAKDPEWMRVHVRELRDELRSVETSQRGDVARVFVQDLRTQARKLAAERKAARGLHAEIEVNENKHTLGMHSLICIAAVVLAALLLKRTIRRVQPGAG